MASQLIAREDFTSVQKAQAGISRLFVSAAKKGCFYRVLRNQEPLGVLVPNELWLSLVEDLEALSSPSYLRAVEVSRRDKKRISARQVKKKLGLIKQ